ncbi:histone-lysine N-methyltransferase SETMAR [Trichonephila clavipes]|nr:histone-lysine N-methyltransferase SETMAR [Trichonephila clavipes]
MQKGSDQRIFTKKLFGRKHHGFVFWDRQSILLLECIPPGKAINAAAYYQTLKRLRRQFKTNAGPLPKKSHIGVKPFHDDDENKDEVEMGFRQQAATFYDSEIQKLVHRLNKCLDNGGDYVDI